MPDLRDCIAQYEQAARVTNAQARVVGISLNTQGCDEAGALSTCDEISSLTGVPCIDPMRHALDPILDALPGWLRRWHLSWHPLRCGIGPLTGRQRHATNPDTPSLGDGCPLCDGGRNREPDRCITREVGARGHCGSRRNHGRGLFRRDRGEPSGGALGARPSRDLPARSWDVADIAPTGWQPQRAWLRAVGSWGQTKRGRDQRADRYQAGAVEHAVYAVIGWSRCHGAAGLWGATADAPQAQIKCRCAAWLPAGCPRGPPRCAAGDWREWQLDTPVSHGRWGRAGAVWRCATWAATAAWSRQRARASALSGTTMCRRIVSKQ